MRQMLKAPFHWPGGKFNLRSKLLPLLPSHRQYIEPYFGAGGVFFAKKPALVETINDIDGGVTGFFAALRDYPKELERLACLTEYSRALYDDCKATWRTESDPVRRAWKWWVVANQSRGGTFGGGWGYDVRTTSRQHSGTSGDGRPDMPRAVRQALLQTERFAAVAERLLTVQIENRPALDVLRTHCRPDSLAYLDPPYHPDTCTPGIYEHEMTPADYDALVAALLELPGKFVLSGYACYAHRPLEEAGWVRVDFTTTCLLSGCREAQVGIPDHAKRVESVWLDPATASEVLPAARPRLQLEAAG